MKKILLLTFLSITFITTQINAKDSDKTEDELVAEFMKSVEREKLADKRLLNSKRKTALLKKKTEDLKQLSKTVNKLANTIGVNGN